MVRARNGLVVVEMMLSTPKFYTKSQIYKLQRQYDHPYAEKLFNLLEKGKPKEVTPTTLSTLKKLEKRFLPRRRKQNAPR